MNESSGHIDEKLKQWLEGDLSQTEWDQYKQSSGNSEQLERMEQLAKHAEGWAIPEPKLSKAEAWQSLQTRLAAKSTDALSERPIESVPVIPIWRKPWVAGVAASLLILVCVWFFYSSKPQEIYNPQGNTLSHELPDHSSILLNADSKITYQSQGFKKERLVTLQGEAFFEVKSGSSFIVQSDYGQVKVLGTSFNVYSRNDKFEVACATGKVQVSIPGQPPVVLTAGMVTTLAEESLMVDNSLDENHILGWQQGEFYFKDAPMSEVISELQRQLNLHIIYDTSVDNMIYTGFFNRKDQDAALQSVLDPMGLTYQMKGDTVLVE